MRFHDDAASTGGPAAGRAIRTVIVTAAAALIGGAAFTGSATFTDGAPTPPLPAAAKVYSGAPVLFAANGNSIVPIPTATNTPGTPIPVPPPPGTVQPNQQVVITPDGITAFVLDTADNMVVPVDLDTRTLAAGIPVPKGSDTMVMTPDGSTILVSSPKAPVSEGQAGVVTPIDVAHHTAGTAIPVPNATGIAVTPDSSTAYITDPAGNQVHIVTLATGKETGAISLVSGKNPHGAVITDTLSGPELYVVSDGGDFPEVEWISLPGGAQHSITLYSADLGSVSAIAASPDGRRVLVGARSSGHGHVVPITTTNHQVDQSGFINLQLLTNVTSIAFSPDSTSVYLGVDGTQRGVLLPMGSDMPVLIPLQGDTTSLAMRAKPLQPDAWAVGVGPAALSTPGRIYPFNSANTHHPFYGPQIQVPAGAQESTITPDGAKLLVTAPAFEQSANVTVVDTRTGHASPAITLTMGTPTGIATTDNRFAWVAINPFSGHLGAIQQLDVSTNSPVGPPSFIPAAQVSALPHCLPDPCYVATADALALSPDGTTAFVADEVNDVLWVADLTVHPVAFTNVPLGTSRPTSISPGAGQPPVISLGVTPDGSTVVVGDATGTGECSQSTVYYVTNGGPKATGRRKDLPAKTDAVLGVRASPPARSPSVGVWHRSPKVATLPEGMTDLVVSPDGLNAYVADSNFCISQLPSLYSVPVGSPTATRLQPPLVQGALAGVAVTPDGVRTLVASGYLSNGIPSAIDVGIFTCGCGSRTLWPTPDTFNDNALWVTVRPDQAPTARFTATVNPAGQVSTFDGSTSSASVGDIASWQWNFGDNSPTVRRLSPLTSHVYAAAGPHNVTLTVTDVSGTSTTQVFTGRQMLRNGGPSATVTVPIDVPNPCTAASTSSTSSSSTSTSSTSTSSTSTSSTSSSSTSTSFVPGPARTAAKTEPAQSTVPCTPTTHVSSTSSSTTTTSTTTTSTTTTSTTTTTVPGTGSLVVTAHARGSKVAFSFGQTCSSREQAYALHDGESHRTQALPEGTSCAVRALGANGVVQVDVSGSVTPPRVVRDPATGIGAVPALGTLKMNFTVPPGSVVVGLAPGRGPTPPRAAAALSAGATPVVSGGNSLAGSGAGGAGGGAPGAPPSSGSQVLGESFKPATSSSSTKPLAALAVVVVLVALAALAWRRRVR